ncbi:MAG: Crp/Fnr family transcriptional regulator [Vicingaceae bacterium]
MENVQRIKELLKVHYPQLTEPELINEISSFGRLGSVKQGDILIDLDEEISFLPLLYNGVIRVHREDDEGRELLLYYLEAGNTCASSLTCCMAHKRSAIRAEAEEDTDFISIPINYVDKWIAVYKSWKDFIMNTYSVRFEELLKTVDELAFKKLDERLLHYLQDKAKVTGSHTLQIAHRQIAYDLNSSREVISRLLKQMERMKYIQLGRGRIELLELELND